MFTIGRGLDEPSSRFVCWQNHLEIGQKSWKNKEKFIQFRDRLTRGDPKGGSGYGIFLPPFRLHTRRASCYNRSSLFYNHRCAMSLLLFLLSLAVTIVHSLSFPSFACSLCSTFSLSLLSLVVTTAHSLSHSRCLLCVLSLFLSHSAPHPSGMRRNSIRVSLNLPLPVIRSPSWDLGHWIGQGHFYLFTFENASRLFDPDPLRRLFNQGFH